jgi:hypothetical protein
MAITLREYRHGRIIGAYLRTKKGGRELHPAIILTPNEEIVQPEQFDPRKGGDNVVVVIGVSTKYRLYPQEHVRLPFRPTGHARTRLSQDCAAIIGWYDIVDIPDGCRYLAGDVPAALMAQINDCVRADISRRIGREFTTLADILPLLLPE